MKTNMIMKWAAAATLACITMNLSAQIAITGTDFTSAGFTIASASNGANKPSGFNSTSKTFFLTDLDPNKGKQLSFDVQFGDSTTDVIAAGAVFNFGFVYEGEPSVAYGRLTLGSGLLQIEERGSGGTMQIGTELDKKTIAAAETGIIYHYDFSVICVGEHSYDITTNIFKKSDNTLVGTLTTPGVTLTYDTSKITNLSFRNFNALGIPTYITNLNLYSVESVPEPSTWMLLGSSVALLAFLRRRK